ncbi:putative nicotinate-nucleotide adenylyltransferase [Alicyclobacillus contaminans]|uniref:nicotinate (nicotinamide) nucleotide adenylyltransferase n=1 Tax=Alicyclobacillus contaminans TaxID=392016 RepID=UPI001FDEB904|nr:nicotinate (nicotinamide) nucleotide adenylyltransferase [Alicyclobacillus contaminans]GMA52121.1 putative nicotinate-nucleotide adenylyltransferase [Alicyclobacillus contaminans]
MNVILFGGTFNPPHVGHLMMSQLALEQTGADAVWFLPALVPPHKQQVQEPFELRVQMVEALIAGMPGMSVCDIERELPVPSYTVDTLRALRRRYPDYRFQFLLGADSLATLPGWYRADELVHMATILVAARTGHSLTDVLSDAKRQLPAMEVRVVEMPLSDVSSTFLRDRLNHGLPTCGWVPEAVLELWRRYTTAAGEGTCGRTASPGA